MFQRSGRVERDPTLDRAVTAEGGTDFVNPWAECWGTMVRCRNTAPQMRADAAASFAPARAQMTGAGEPPVPPIVLPTAEADLVEADALATSRIETEVAADGGLIRTLPVINHKGLHARASAKFVQTVEGFDCKVTVSRGGETVGGTSIMGLMMLAAAKGTEITVETSGPDADAAMAAIETLLATKFGEEC